MKMYFLHLSHALVINTIIFHTSIWIWTPDYNIFPLEEGPFSLHKPYSRLTTRGASWRSGDGASWRIRRPQSPRNVCLNKAYCALNRTCIFVKYIGWKQIQTLERWYAHTRTSASLQNRRIKKEELDT